MLIFLRLLALTLCLIAPLPSACLIAPLPSANAQQVQPMAAQQASEVVATQKAVLDDLSRQIEVVEKQVDNSADADGKLLELRLELEEIQSRVLSSGVAFRPRLNEINARLEQLGSPPAEGQPPESDLVSKERAALLAEKGDINVLIGNAEDLSIRVSGLIDKIATLRSDLFTRLLTDRYNLVDAFGSETLADGQREVQNVYRSIAAWLKFVFNFKFHAFLAAGFLALGFAALLLIGGRRLFGRFLEPDRDAEDPSYLTRLSVAFWSTLLPTLALAAFFAATAFLFNYFNVLRGDIGTFLRSLAQEVLMIFGVNRLARAALSPHLPNWRLVHVESKPARWLVAMATAMATVLGISVFLSEVNQQMGSPLSLTIARSFIATSFVAVLFILIGLIHPFKTQEGKWRPWPTWLRVFLFAVGGFTLAAALLGYIGLAMFVSIQVVVTGTLLVLAYIGFLSGRAISDEGGFAATIFGRRLAAGKKMDATTLDQIGLGVGIGINLLILAIFVPLVLLTWGFQIGDLRAWAHRFSTGVQVGSINISFTGILTGILVFVGGYLLTRWFQGWLDGSVMARGRIDTGVRNSIRTVVGYAGLAISGLIGISAAGLDLSNLALIAGGLSLGIGFGLQNVVSNFVSGLILLAERPFKAGDWVVTGAIQGTVKKISVRATEIETFQRQTVIVPNSELINAAVGNWTHRNKLGRIDIPIGVGYGSDPRKVHAILMEVIKAHPLVLKNPEPAVAFTAFGASSLDFEVRAFLADITTLMRVQNDVRFAIVERFAEEGIEIPFPRTDVEVRGVVPVRFEREASEFIGEKPASADAGDDEVASGTVLDKVDPPSSGAPAGKKTPTRSGN